jgi:hypothetical protein
VVALRYRLTTRDALTIAVAEDQVSRSTAVFAVGFAFVVAWAAGAGDWVQATAWAALFLVFPAGLLAGLRAAWMRRRWADREIAMVIDPAVIETRTDQAESSVQWSAIMRVRRQPDALLLDTKIGADYAIPRRVLTAYQEAAVLRMAGPRVVEQPRPWLRPIGAGLVGMFAFAAVYAVMAVVANLR